MMHGQQNIKFLKTENTERFEDQTALFLRI